MSDLIVVETPDTILVGDKARSQNVDHTVNQLKFNKREEQLLHHKVHPPWGWYDCIDEGAALKSSALRSSPRAQSEHAKKL